MPPKLDLPPSRALLALIAIAFVLPGLTGHDPWKQFDVVAIEIARNMLHSGDWLVPSVAGQPWGDDPPLFHWIAAVFGAALGWALPFHDAARVASGFLVFVSLVFLYFAAKSWAHDADRHGTAASAVLILVGSIGLMVHAHEATTDLAGLAACAGALAALAYSQARPVTMGAAFGAALGAGFLSTGFPVPLALAATSSLSHLVCAPWRTRKGLVFFAVAVPVAVAIAASWPLALWHRAPAFLELWWSNATETHGGFAANLRFFIEIAAWFAWPGWLLAVWAMWTLRRRWNEPHVFVPLAGSITAVVCVAAFGPPQDVSSTVVLVPLALLASHGVARLPRGGSAALDWFGVMTFTFFAGLVWLGYVAMMLGVPAKIADNYFARLAPGFSAPFRLLPFLVALALTAAWLYLALRTAPSVTRGVTRWAAGVVLLWGTVAMLWLPWVDHQRSYRSVALQLKSLIPTDAECVTGRALGTAQRAALAYHARLRTVPYDPLKPEACPLQLVQGNPTYETDRPDARWRKIADVGRPGDKIERYRLYERQK
jgi:4-amino-4-deoxy-L-arabinose transferase-like glycosyltransferase